MLSQILNLVVLYLAVRADMSSDILKVSNTKIHINSAET